MKGRPPKYPWRTIALGRWFLMTRVKKPGGAVSQAIKANRPKRFNAKRVNAEDGRFYFRITRTA